MITSKVSRIVPYLGFLLLSAGIFLWHNHFAFIQFGGNDGGILIQTAWAQYLGQIPYREITTPLPALFVYPAGWAFIIGGPTWSSLTLLVSFFSIFTFAWTFVLLNRATGNAWTSLIFAFVLQAITMLSYSWWWYNQVTAVVEAIYVASIFFLLFEPKDWFARGSFWLAVALTGMAKANTAGPLLILTHLFLLTRPSTRLFVLLASSSAMLADLLFFTVHHTSIILLLQNYFLLTGRLISPKMWTVSLFQALPGEQILSLFFDGLLVAALCHILCKNKYLLNREGCYVPFMWLLLILLVVGEIGAITNSFLKMTEASCLIMVAPFIQFVLDKHGLSLAQSKLAYVYSILAYFVFMGLYIGATRTGIFAIGPSFFAETRPLQQVQAPPLFRGMQVGPIMNEVLVEVHQVLQEQDLLHHPDKKVFFGPRINFCYAAYNLPVEPGLPACWERIPSSHHGDNLPTGIYMPDYQSAPARWIQAGEPLDPRVVSFIQTHFDLCIFLRGYLGLADMTYFPSDLRAELYSHYRVQYRGQIVVFTRID